jgi:OFA family oxalate/formate antiporter-like MFS transporter
MIEAKQTLEEDVESRSWKTNRWGIAAAGLLMQMALGTAYAWSVFRVPLAEQFHWSIEEVTLTFTIANFALGASAFFGGLWLNKKGPRVVALTGGFLMVSVFSWQPSQ